MIFSLLYIKKNDFFTDQPENFFKIENHAPQILYLKEMFEDLFETHAGLLLL